MKQTITVVYDEGFGTTHYKKTADKIEMKIIGDDILHVGWIIGRTVGVRMFTKGCWFSVETEDAE